MNLPPFQIHGSPDSLDYDVMVFPGTLPPVVEASAELCREFAAELKRFFNVQGMAPKKMNINIATIRDGHVQQVFKGASDEVNNACFLTYKHSQQFHPLQIQRTVPRNLPLKTARSLRSICSMISRTQHRTRIKTALRDVIGAQIQTLKSISLAVPLDNSSKRLSDEDMYKTIAFQLGQVMALREGIEIYTKKGLSDHFPELSGFLGRDLAHYDFAGLERLKQEWLGQSEEFASEYGHLRESDLYP